MDGRMDRQTDRQSDTKKCSPYVLNSYTLLHTIPQKPQDGNGRGGNIHPVCQIAITLTSNGV